MPPTSLAPKTRDIIPASFEELYAHYFTYVVRYVVKLGIDPQNAEDVAQTVLQKFFEKDALSDFNPDYWEGASRKALFITFLSGFVKLYVRHYRDREQKHIIREGNSINAPASSDDSSGAEWIDVHGHEYVSYTETYDDMHYRELVTGIRSRLSEVRSSNSQDKCNLVDFFNAVLQQTYDDGKIDTAVLAEQFNVSKTSIQNWLKRLRAEVSIVVEAA